jgi:ribosomal protein L32
MAVPKKRASNLKKKCKLLKKTVKIKNNCIVLKQFNKYFFKKKIKNNLFIFYYF